VPTSSVGLLTRLPLTLRYFADLRAALPIRLQRWPLYRLLWRWRLRNLAAYAILERAIAHLQASEADRFSRAVQVLMDARTYVSLPAPTAALVIQEAH
jgi:hypothetical protein